MMSSRDTDVPAQPAAATQDPPAGPSAPSPRTDRILGIIALVAVLPLVFDATSKTVPLVQLFTGVGEPDPTSSRLHVVLPAIAVLAVVAVRRRQPSLWRPLPVIVILLVAQFTVVIAWGLLDGAGLVGFLFYVQTIIPLVAWLAFYRLTPTPRTLARAIMVGVLALALAALVYTAVHGGIGNSYYSSIALEDPFPQYRAYYPVLVALAIAVAVASIRTDRLLSISTIAGCLLLVPIMWSRAGICMVVLALVSSMFWCHFRGMAWHRRILLATSTAVVLAVLGAVSLTWGLATQRTELNDLQASDNERVTLAQESTERIASSPIAGDAFKADTTELPGGAIANFDRLFPSHNQYLDYGIRGGAPALLLLVLFLVLTAWMLFRRWLATRQQDFEPMYGAALGFLTALVPGGLTELYISQTWTGVAIMIFLGSIAGMMAREPGSRPRRLRRAGRVSAS